MACKDVSRESRYFKKNADELRRKAAIDPDMLGAGEMERAMSRVGKTFETMPKDSGEAFSEAYGKMRSLTVETYQAMGDNVSAWRASVDMSLRSLKAQYGDYFKYVHKEYSKLLGAQQEAMTAEYWGVKRAIDSQRELRQAFAQEVESTFYNTFVGAFDRNLKGAREIFRAFLTDLRNMLLKFLSQRIAWMIFGQMLGIPGGSVQFPALPPMLGAGMPSGSSLPMGALSKQAGTSYVPRRGMYYLHEGEEVTPAGSKGGKGGDSYNIVIQAVDARSFADLVARNPDAIVSVVQKDMRLNRGTRRSVRQLR